MMTADRASTPGNLYGWGIIDVLAAIKYQSNQEKGDANDDGVINVLDAMTVVNFILGLTEPGPTQFWGADCNDDGFLNVLDIICIAKIILGGR